jgi:hypothetical protein
LFLPIVAPFGTLITFSIPHSIKVKQSISPSTIIISEMLAMLAACSTTEVRCPLSFLAGIMQPKVLIIPPTIYVYIILV